MGISKTHAAIRSPELKRLRAIAMLRERVQGMSINEIAEEHRVSSKTVERTLSYAKRAGIIVEESDRILEDMVPLARDVLITALKEGDVSVAMKVYEGTGLFGNKGKPAGANSGDDELLKHMELLRQQAQALEETTEGELIDSTERFQLPPATQRAPEKPDEALSSLPTESQEAADESGFLSAVEFAS